MLNKVFLQGRLTADPEFRTTSNDTSVVSFSLAVDKPYAKQGEARTADFFNLTAWRNTADFIAKYFKKGQMMIVEGLLQNNSYTDNNGQKRTVTQVLVEKVNFADTKNQNSTSKSKEVEYEPVEDDDADLPF